MRTEDELAGIIAHEMSHVLARHSAEAITRSMLSVLVIALIEALTGARSCYTASMSVVYYLSRSCASLHARSLARSLA